MTRPKGFAVLIGCLILSGGVRAAPDDVQPAPNQPALKIPKQAAQRPASLPPAPAPHAPVHSAVFRPREDPARAHAKFDEHVRDPERERAILQWHEHDFHVADVRHFHEQEWAAWRSGHWYHALYDGRLGWYYEVGSVWYPYGAPVMPYPTTVAPLVYDEAPEADGPAAAPLPALPRVAYHCATPQGFYPTVTACDTEWVAIAAH